MGLESLYKSIKRFFTTRRRKKAGAAPPVREELAPVSNALRQSFDVGNEHVDTAEDMFATQRVERDMEDMFATQRVELGAEDAPVRDPLDAQIYEKEKYFIPSPSAKHRAIIDESFGNLRQVFGSDMLPRGEQFLPEWKNWSMDRRQERLDDASSPQQREAAGIARGMLPQEDEQASNFAQYFMQGGEFAELDDSMDANRDIAPTADIALHVYLPSKYFSAMQFDRYYKKYTSVFRPGIFKYATNGKKLNDKIKRSVILDYMQKELRANPLLGKGVNLSRDQLRLLYEEAYRKYKDDDSVSTGLDRSENSGADEKGDLLSGVDNDSRQEVVNKMTTWIDSQQTGHAWIELKSKYANQEERVRFTVGYSHRQDVKSPFDKVPGLIVNPDYNDAIVGTFQKTASIGKQGYLNALQYALQFNETTYSLVGANCTSFAVGMAKAAGMQVDGGYKITPFGRIFSPDILAQSGALTEFEGNEREVPEAYRNEKPEVTENPNDPDDNTLMVNGQAFVLSSLYLTQEDGKLFVKAREQTVEKTDTYKYFIEPLPADYKMYWNWQLRKEISNRYHELSETARVIFKYAVQQAENGEALSPALARFGRNVSNEVLGVLNTPREFIERARASREEEFAEFARQENQSGPGMDTETLVMPTADALFRFFNDGGGDGELLISVVRAVGKFKRKYDPAIFLKSFCLAVETCLFQQDDMMEIYRNYMGKAQLSGESGLREFIQRCFKIPGFSAAFKELVRANQKKGSVDDLYFGLEI